MEEPNTVVQENVKPVDQMEELKKAAHKFIDECDGFLLFPYKLVEVEQNGQKAKVSKSMTKESGAIGGGAVNIAHTAKKSQELLASENAVRNQQIAQLAE